MSTENRPVSAATLAADNDGLIYVGVGISLVCLCLLAFFAGHSNAAKLHRAFLIENKMARYHPTTGEFEIGQIKSIEVVFEEESIK
jgi:hypothetical protein